MVLVLLSATTTRAKCTMLQQQRHAIIQVLSLWFLLFTAMAKELPSLVDDLKAASAAEELPASVPDPNDESRSEVSLIPEMPREVQDKIFPLAGNGLLNLWHHGLLLQHNKDTDAAFASSRAAAATSSVIKTIVAPDSYAFINLVPMDSVHPLYYDGPYYNEQRRVFITDNFIDRLVDPDDAALSTAAGLTVLNMNGKEMNFKKNGHQLSVNGVPIVDQSLLSDGTQLYVIKELLFGHRDNVRKSYDRLMKSLLQDGKNPCYGPCE